MSDPRYLRPGVDFALAHAIEEAGEFLSAAGKTQRWGLDSFNPELAPADQETNEAWLRREANDLTAAISRLFVALNVRAEEPRTAKPDNMSLGEALDDLQQAEAEYRLMHDLHGDGAQAAGRAWDLMRRAGDSARLLLNSAVPE